MRHCCRFEPSERPTKGDADIQGRRGRRLLQQNLPQAVMPFHHAAHPKAVILDRLGRPLATIACRCILFENAGDALGSPMENEMVALARRHVIQGRRIVERQRQRVGELVASGLSTEGAKLMLR